MSGTIPHIVVCICTYKRPELLVRLLTALSNQQSSGKFTFSVVIADNDRQESAREIVQIVSESVSYSITYCVEPIQNIALVRNKALKRAGGDYIAFIDDDEFPSADWLYEMLTTCQKLKVSGVLGPVRPHFDQQPPAWILKGRFCERPEYPTGTRIGWTESRTGNVLFRKDIIEGIGEPFNPEFPNGGEDKDFFMRMEDKGHIFVWCNEAPVFETVPPSRWSRSYMLKRALLRGKNILKHPKGKAMLFARSATAIPIYLLGLPVFLACGQHVFMKYSVKLCDHLGRFLGLLNLNPVNERQL